jgi:hypothetical protein
VIGLTIGLVIGLVIGVVRSGAVAQAELIRTIALIAILLGRCTHAGAANARAAAAAPTSTTAPRTLVAVCTHRVGIARAIGIGDEIRALLMHVGAIRRGKISRRCGRRRGITTRPMFPARLLATWRFATR